MSGPMRLYRSVLALVVAVMLVLPIAASAQTPALAPASTFGDGWKEMTKSGQTGQAAVKYVKSGGQEVEKWCASMFR